MALEGPLTAPGGLAADQAEAIRGEWQSRMDAAEGAWRVLSVEASHVIDVLRRRSAPPQEVLPWAS